MSKNTKLCVKMRLGFTFINLLGEMLSKQDIHTLISLFQIHPSGLYHLKLKEKVVQGKNCDFGIQKSRCN